jgi:hypothetical protein
VWLWACGGDSLPGIVPSVTFEPTLVRMGSPAEATFTFALDSGAPALTSDSVVRLELRDVKGVVLWSEEHSPPVPTSRWAPGETVTYKRAVSIPVLPHLGETVAVVSLMGGPASAGLTRLDPGAVRGETTLRLLPPFELLQMRMRGGWYTAEYNPADPRIEWRWSGPEATVALENPKVDVSLSLYFEGFPEQFPPSDPPHLFILVGDRVVERVPIVDARGPIRREVVLPAEALGGDEVVNVTLRVYKPVRPADLPGSDGKDTRVLGIRLFSLVAEPRHSTAE